jgi:hypothetical protein
MNGKSHNPIFVTGADRSGSTMIAKILDLCKVSSGSCNGMLENKVIVEANADLLSEHFLSFPDTESLKIPYSWKAFIDGVRLAQMNGSPWMVKHSSLARLWPVYHYAFPNAKWIIVRRRTGDIVHSCMKTGYMKEFKCPLALQKLELTTEQEGWLWWVRRYEERFIEMMQAGLNCKIIWPERMVTGDYEQIFEMVDWVGLKWNNKIPSIIDPMLNKSREGLS